MSAQSVPTSCKIVKFAYENQATILDDNDKVTTTSPSNLAVSLSTFADNKKTPTTSNKTVNKLKLTKKQELALRREFAKNAYVSPGRAVELANNLKLVKQNVMIWFSDQRRIVNGNDNDDFVKQKRWIPTADQLAVLKHAYEMNKYIDKSRRQAIAEDLKVDEKAVMRWFAACRRKEKKQNETAVNDFAAVGVDVVNPNNDESVYFNAPSFDMSLDCSDALYQSYNDDLPEEFVSTKSKNTSIKEPKNLNEYKAHKRRRATRFLIDNDNAASLNDYDDTMEISEIHDKDDDEHVVSTTTIGEPYNDDEGDDDEEMAAASYNPLKRQRIVNQREADCHSPIIAGRRSVKLSNNNDDMPADTSVYGNDTTLTYDDDCYNDSNNVVDVTSKTGAKKKTSQLTKEQSTKLQDEFVKGAKIGKNRAIELAVELNMSAWGVTNWFRKRRNEESVKLNGSVDHSSSSSSSFTVDIVNRLKEEYNECTRLDNARKKLLANELGIKESSVYNWFYRKNKMDKGNAATMDEKKSANDDANVAAGQIEP